MSNDTRHLDTAIAILKGTGGAKRAKRKAQVELILYVYTKAGTYDITSNGRMLVSQARIVDSDPHMVLKARRQALLDMNRTVSTQSYTDMVQGA